MHKLLSWDIYEITSRLPVNSIMLRGRIRKFGLEHGLNILVENTEDLENGVRFAVLAGVDASSVISYVKSVVDVSVKKVAENVANPVLSKLKVNDEGRYTL